MKQSANTIEVPTSGVFYGLFKIQDELRLTAVVSGVLYDRTTKRLLLSRRATKTFTAPARCAEIKTRAFAAMQNLESLVFGAPSMKKRHAQLHNEAFAECSRLSRVLLPEGLESVGARCFQGCGVRELTLPKSVSAVREGAFAMCRGLKTLSVQNESRLKSLERRAFFRSGLETLELNEGLLTIGPACFEECEIDEIVLPQTVAKIGAGAFAARTNVFVGPDS